MEVEVERSEVSISSSSAVEIRDEERELVRSDVECSCVVGISLLRVSLCFVDGKRGTYNRPRPLDPSAIVRLSPSFLICIATCYSRQVTSGKFHSHEKRTFLRFAAVFVSFWQNPQMDSHFAMDRTPVVFQGG
jgi:hypothetical protein